MKHYKNKTDCLVNQYNKYCFTSYSDLDIHVDENLCFYVLPDKSEVDAHNNGTLTLGENVADSAIRGSYMAYGMILFDKIEC